MPYRDLHEYISVLEHEGLFKWVYEEVDKDWELSCVARLLFRGLPEDERIAVGFKNVKGYTMPVVIGVVGGSRRIVATALETEPTPIAIIEKLSKGEREPIEPKLVSTGPVKDIVMKGDEVDLYKLPIPIWTPGKDPSPYLTPLVITKDPDTGIRNMGMYRSQLKGKNKLGIQWHPYRGGYMHMEKYENKGENTPIALVIGADPAIYYAGISRVPHGLDELAIAGGIKGEPIELVKCETIDLEVPAYAEIVIEGEIPCKAREPEGPFGEWTGYMSYGRDQPYIIVKCITHRRNAIFQGLISQLRPSESSVINSITLEGNLYKHLVYDMKIPGIKDICVTDSWWIWISVEKPTSAKVHDIFHGVASGARAANYKYVVVVDDDVNIRDAFAREWALTFRVRPEEDIIITRKTWPLSLDPSAQPPYPGAPTHTQETGKVFIDATKKYSPFPEVALPPKEYLDRVLKNWDKYGLPKLSSFYPKRIEETFPCVRW